MAIMNGILTDKAEGRPLRPELPGRSPVMNGCKTLVGWRCAHAASAHRFDVLQRAAAPAHKTAAQRTPFR